MIYVMSDIHGHRRRFDSVMKQINLQPEDTLYILGDVIDRNPDGIRILQQLRAMPNVVKTNEALKPSCTGATLLEGKVWKSTAKKEELSVWADSLACR